MESVFGELITLRGLALRNLQQLLHQLGPESSKLFLWVFEPLGSLLARLLSWASLGEPKDWSSLAGSATGLAVWGLHGSGKLNMVHVPLTQVSILLVRRKPLKVLSRRHLTSL